MEGVYLFIIFASIVVAVLYSNRRILKPLTEVLDEEQAEVKGILNPRIEGHFHGREVRLVLDQGRRPETLRMEFFTGKSWQLEVKKRTIWTALEEQVRPSSHTATHESEFDSRFAIFSFPSKQFAAWLVKPEVKASIEELFDRDDIKQIEHGEQSLKATFEFYLSRKCSPARVRPVLELMTRLLQSLESNIR